ncbi:MAG: hypothetical protein D6784_02805 [Chloroflexi bacterium]|nr:MAG: hypothetical protein D6784_02805 [Chloroflexota bacterium]
MEPRKHKTVFVSVRSARHRQAALQAAPDVLDVVLLFQPSPPELRRHLAGAEFLISERRGRIDADLLRAAPGLRLVLRLGSLWYDIDLPAASEAGVAVCWWPLGGVIRVAEHVVLQMLALGKRLTESTAVAQEAGPHWGPSRRTDENTFAYNWTNRQDLHGLWQKTVGILGFGEIGVELARRLAGWGCTVLYHKRHRLPEAVEARLGIRFSDRAQIFSDSDYVVNLLPYSPDTDLSLGRADFARMKPGAYLVSCGSGSVIDETALAEFIRRGRLAGAALDTFEWEPLRPDNPLLVLARQGGNVLLTPHIAAGDTAAAAEERRQMYTPVLRFLAGEPVPNRLV